MKTIFKILACMLALAGTDVFAQIRKEPEYITVNTGHPSISLTLLHDGVGVECKVVNSNPNVKYDISYSVDYEFVCGTNKKTISEKGSVKPNGQMVSLNQPISDCVSKDGKRTANSVRNARLASFNAIPVKENNSASSTEKSNQVGNNSNRTPAQTNSKPPANANLQELAEWQRKQYGTVQKSSSNINASGTTEQKERLKALQEQQKKAQENANYEKAVAYEQQRQQSIQQSHETINAVTGAVKDYLNQRQAEKQQEREEQDRRMEEENRRSQEEYYRKQALELKINNRKTALAEFPAKDIPLGSQEKATSIYYFIYAHDNSINNENGAVVYISNVFEIGRYKDGTRAYTATLKNEIANLTPFQEILHGYYYTQQEAEELRQTLLSILRNNDVTINEVNYKRKPATKSIVNESTAPKASSSKYGKTISTGSDNLAPAKLNDAKPNGVPKQLDKAKEKESKYGKTIKID